MNRMPDNIGRTVMIAVIAGLLFAGFLAITPRLTASSKSPEAGGPAVVVTTVPTVEEAIAAPTVEVPVEQSAPRGAFDVYEPETVEETWDDEAPPADEPTDETWPAPRIDGTLDLRVEVLGPRDGKEVAILSDEDMAQWHFEVVNTGPEGLWGVYVYLEGHGPVDCDDTYLAPGATTECWASDMVWAGEQTAEAWATAWTAVDEVAAEISFAYFVGE